MRLVVDASVALKWAIRGADSAVAFELLASETLMLPDFWLNEATNALWVQAWRGLMSAEDVRDGLTLLKERVPSTVTAAMDLHASALEIALEVGCSPYDTLYAAFALAIGADHVIAADRPFLAALRRHPDPAVARLPLDLRDWASGRGATSPGGA